MNKLSSKTNKAHQIAEIQQFLNQSKILKQITNQNKLINAILNKKSIYCGFDPTGNSLHIGHFLPIYVLKQFQKWGCKVIIILGGLTGGIGDPSFRTKRRTLQTHELLNENQRKIIKQFQQFLPTAKIYNNLDWYKNMNVFEFFQKLGKAFTINKILQKKSISNAFEKKELFYDEFSYLLLQAYDFYHLYKNEECFIQLGGSDQYPNITMGIDLISKLEAPILSQAAGITTVLVTQNNQKISKTDANFLSLDLKISNLYQYFQFFINLNDDDLANWINWLQINSKELKNHSFQQKKLIVAKKVIEILFSTKIVQKWNILINTLAKSIFSQNDFVILQKYLPFQKIAKNPVLLKTILLSAKIFNSTASFKRAIQENSIKINDLLIQDWNYLITPHDQTHYGVIKYGKKIVLLIQY